MSLREDEDVCFESSSPDFKALRFGKPEEPWSILYHASVVGNLEAAKPSTSWHHFDTISVLFGEIAMQKGKSPVPVIIGKTSKNMPSDAFGILRKMSDMKCKDFLAFQKAVTQEELEESGAGWVMINTESRADPDLVQFLANAEAVFSTITAHPSFGCSGVDRNLGALRNDGVTPELLCFISGEPFRPSSGEPDYNLLMHGRVKIDGGDTLWQTWTCLLEIENAKERIYKMADTSCDPSGLTNKVNIGRSGLLVVGELPYKLSQLIFYPLGFGASTSLTFKSDVPFWRVVRHSDCQLLTEHPKGKISSLPASETPSNHIATLPDEKEIESYGGFTDCVINDRNQQFMVVGSRNKRSKKNDYAILRLMSEEDGGEGSIEDDFEIVEYGEFRKELVGEGRHFKDFEKVKAGGEEA
ncbi:hypothetical protein FOL47_009968 [Perkinsus chesapeaki]|uniref:Uncharacterized protein n=1 Tax=Perkinsus chesapeaki TaxID=330153 RepID=A0A7J6L5J8_PERCH|nr:hypothetical protein FOL47_009968 [Perkinsus chesapeaki]